MSERTVLSRRARRLLVLAVAANVAVAGAGCGGSSEKKSPEATTGTSTTAASTTSPTTTGAPSTTGAPTNGETVVNDLSFPAKFTVTKPAGWTTTDFGHPDDVLQLCSDPACKAEVGITNPAGATPKEVVDKIVGESPDYVVGPAADAMAGNMPATRFDLEIADPRWDPNRDGPALLPTAGGGAVGLAVGNTGRIYVVDVRGKPVTILVEAPAAQFDAFQAQAEAVLASLHFS